MALSRRLKWITAAVIILFLASLGGCGGQRARSLRSTVPNIKTTDKVSPGTTTSHQSRAKAGDGQQSAAVEMVTAVVPTYIASAGSASTLLKDGQKALESGDVARAEMLIGRALRVEPKNGDLWFVMARVKLAKGDPAQAVQFCLKSISLGGGHHALLVADYQVMERAYRQMGNRQQAADARRKWQRLER